MISEKFLKKERKKMQLTKKRIGELRITRNEIYVEVRCHDKIMVKKSENKFRKGSLIREIRENVYKDYYEEIGGFRRRDKILEDKMSFIPMAYTFYFYVTTMEHIPSVETFCNFFLNSFCEKTQNGYCFKEQYSSNTEYVFKKENLFAKICRAYNSYLREFLLLETLYELQKKDRYKNLEIIYDVDEDILNGVDILIKNGDKTTGLLITQKSKNADNYNTKKRNHRHKYEYDNYIYLRFNEAETEPVGDTELFTRRTAKDVLEQVLAN